MEISSIAFTNQELIPAKYTCDGNNISPPLSWRDVPADTKSFVLIMDDPDAPMGTWAHWLVYNLPADIRNLPENIQILPTGAKYGLNSWHKLGYGGPCPPSGRHRYLFKLYALDTTLDLKGDVTSNVLQKVMQEHVLAEAQLLGLYR